MRGDDHSCTVQNGRSVPNDNDEARTIVRTIVDLAKNLGLALTAEGIETPDNAEALQALGCETGQGYLFGRPENAETARAQFAELEEAPVAASASVGRPRRGAA